MALLNRKPRPLGREERTFRDDRLFVLATEDTDAPRQYFNLLQQARIKVKTLETPRNTGFSAPQHVLQRLVEFQQEFELGPQDQLWLLLDTDHWIREAHRPNLVAVLNEAAEKGFRLAMSNPCFDLWLLLHHAREPLPARMNCDAVGRQIRALLGEFNKGRLKGEHFTVEGCKAALERAKRLEPNPVGYWPVETGSRVYLLVEELFKARMVGAGK